jgi:hypothetical protein
MTFFDRLSPAERIEFEREANSYIAAATKLGVVLELDDLRALVQAKFNKMLEAFK